MRAYGPFGKKCNTMMTENPCFLGFAEEAMFHFFPNEPYAAERSPTIEICTNAKFRGIDIDSTSRASVPAEVASTALDSPDGVAALFPPFWATSGRSVQRSSRSCGGVATDAPGKTGVVRAACPTSCSLGIRELAAVEMTAAS